MPLPVASEADTTPRDAPGAVYVVPTSPQARSRVFVSRGTAVDHDPELRAGIVDDLQTLIQRAAGPDRLIDVAMASHRGDRANIEYHGLSPGLNHGFESGTRFTEVFFGGSRSREPAPDRLVQHSGLREVASIQCCLRSERYQAET